MVDPTGGKVAIDGQDIVTAGPLAAESGGGVRLSLRPEMITLNNGHPEGNHLTGTLENVVFLGIDRAPGGENG